MPTIRAFIAVNLPADVKAELDRISRELAAALPRGAVRWVRPEQMHLTLRFLGDTPVDRLPAIRTAMDTTAGQHPALALHLGGLGCFPNPKRPRVIWAGLVDDQGQDGRRLVALKESLDDALAPLGWPPEDKPFRAHLTLGRIKDEAAVRDMNWTTGVSPLVLPVTAIHLIESDLRPDGPVYTIRHSSRLAAA